MGSDRKWMWGIVGVLMFGGLVVRVLLGYYYPSLYWGDEVYQTLEPAHRLAFGNGVEVWEYREGLRSWVFPGVLAGVMKVGRWFGDGSTGYLGTVMVFLSLLSLVPAVAAAYWAEREHDEACWPILAACFPVVWFDLVYFAPKAFYETFTAHLTVGALLLVRFDDGRWWMSLVGGTLLGICIVNRPQMAPAAVALGAAVPIFAARPHRRFSSLVVGTVAGLGVGGLVDAFVYGAPFHSTVVNFYKNVIEGKANQWGTSSWWAYGHWTWKASGIGAIGMGLALVASLRRYHALAWPAVALLLAHSVIPHKEYRFIYPVIAIAVVLAGLQAARLTSWAAERWDGRLVRRGAAAAVAAAVTAVSIWGGLHFDVRSTGKSGEVTNWHHHRGKLLAYRYLSERDGLCGLGRYNFPFWETGGYAYLHRDVPIVPIKGKGDLRRQSKAIDAFVAAGWTTETFDNFERDRCFQQICIYTRPGDCPKDPPGNRGF